MRAAPLTGWRRIAAAVWGAPNDPQIYGQFEVDAANLSAFVAAARGQGVRLTPTHLVGRALAHALIAVPSLNVRLIGARVVPRDSVDVFFITSVGAGHDLTGVKIAQADRKSALVLAAELDRRSHALREGNDPNFARSKRLMEHLPRPLLRLSLRALAAIAGDYARGVPALGITPAPFGSAMVSSVGMLGLPGGFTPLAWIYRVPLIVLVGEIADKPVVREGRVVVRPVLPLTATIDHRYVDGAELATALKAFRGYLEDPARFELPPTPR